MTPDPLTTRILESARVHHMSFKEIVQRAIRSGSITFQRPAEVTAYWTRDKLDEWNEKRRKVRAGLTSCGLTVDGKPRIYSQYKRFPELQGMFEKKRFNRKEYFRRRRLFFREHGLTTRGTIPIKRPEKSGRPLKPITENQ